MVMGRLASKKTNDRINVLAISEFNIEQKKTASSLVLQGMK